MIKNIIFDYMGVLAKFDYKTALDEMSTVEKFKTLKVLFHLKTNKTMREAFDFYQTGEFNTDELCIIASSLIPKQATVIPKFLDSIPNHIKDNTPLLNYTKQLKKSGIRLYLLSNSIPETQFCIENNQIIQDFDGVVLSNLIGLKKPNPDIYQFVCNSYGLKPNETLFIDDNTSNLKSASTLKINTLHCNDFNNITIALKNFLNGKPLELSN